MITIYGLQDDSGTIYYVGRTATPRRRMSQHRTIGHQGTMIILDTCNEAEAVARERSWIACYRAQLVNKKERYYTGVSVAEVQAARGR